MKIERIFAVLNKSSMLSAVRYDGEVYEKSHHTELDRLYALWNDYEYLEDFYTKHHTDLQSGHFGLVTVDDAIEETIMEVQDLFSSLLNAAQLADKGDYSMIHGLFKPYHANPEAAPVLTLKAYGSQAKSYLRLYALSLNNGPVVIIGGSIKLSKSMQSLAHSNLEHKKILRAANFFRSRLSKVSLDDTALLPEDLDALL